MKPSDYRELGLEMPVSEPKPLNEPRFFGRVASFEMECPHCGKLMLVGHGRRDDRDFNRVSCLLTCRKQGEMIAAAAGRGCGRKFFIGIVAWPIVKGTRGKRAMRPPDQRATDEQLVEMRNYARGVWAQVAKRRGDNLNVLQPSVDLDDTSGT